MKEVTLILLSIIIGIFGCATPAESALTPEPQSIDTPTSTQEPTPDTPTALARCRLAPQSIVDKLNGGLTAHGDTQLVAISFVENNDDRPWRFIGGRFVGPGFDGQTGVWASASLDFDETALIVAADSISDEFSIWSRPMGDARFASIFDDEIGAAHLCAE